MKAVAQYTISSVNDMTPSPTAPPDPYVGQVWQDTSVTPPVLRSWDGTRWVVCNDVEIGGRNLLKKSGMRHENTGYPIATYLIGDDKPKHGDICTVQIKGKLGEGKTQWGIYNSSGKVRCAYIYASACVDGIYTITFPWVVSGASNTYLYVYPMPSGVNTNSVIEWIKLERGSKATGWMPAPEDVQAEIDGVRKTTESNSTDLTVQQGKINALINNTIVVEEDGKTVQLKDKTLHIAAEVDGLTSTVSETEQTANDALRGNSILDQTGAKTFCSPCSLHKNSSGLLGYLIIETPIIWPYMTRVEISGYNYAKTTSDISLVVSFYAYSDKAFHQCSYSSSGNFPISSVRLARKGNASVIIIGAADTKWDYPQIYVDRAKIGYTNPPDDYANGWTIQISPDISTYTNLMTVSGLDEQAAIKSTSVKQSQIEQTVSGITQRVTAVESAEGSLSQKQTQLEQTALGIQTTVAEIQTVVDDQGKTIGLKMDESVFTQVKNKFEMAFKLVGASGYARTGKTEFSADGIKVYDGAIKVVDGNGKPLFYYDNTSKILYFAGSFVSDNGTSSIEFGEQTLSGNFTEDGLLKYQTKRAGMVLKKGGSIYGRIGSDRTMVSSSSGTIDSSENLSVASDENVSISSKKSINISCNPTNDLFDVPTIHLSDTEAAMHSKGTADVSGSSVIINGGTESMLYSGRNRISVSKANGAKYNEKFFMVCNPAVETINLVMWGGWKDTGGWGVKQLLRFGPIVTIHACLDGSQGSRAPWANIAKIGAASSLGDMHKDWYTQDTENVVAFDTRGEVYELLLYNDGYLKVGDCTLPSGITQLNITHTYVCVGGGRST